MLEWLPAPIDQRELELRAKSGKTWPVMKLVSGPWTIAKWDLSDPRYALWRDKERWPKQFGFKTAKEAMDLANDMERRGV
jgi:hypothetical protein